jgi:DNA sulfur modification protein DndB
MSHLVRNIQPEANLTQFDRTHVGAMDSRKSGEFLLGETLRFALAAEHSTKKNAHVRGHEWQFSALHTGCLQMSVYNRRRALFGVVAAGSISRQPWSAIESIEDQMGNRTLIPVLRCKVDTWRYYICKMKYGEVARRVSLPCELGNDELAVLIQRGISARTKDITQYLLKSPHRFLGGIVVAAWGGEPQYTPLSMDDPEGILKGLDREFGVLTFDGTQAYFVLDGQHRLRAIKDAMKQTPDIGKEDICVLIVTHYDTADGRMRTRRLFSNINRNAKQTGQAENVALDEDDGFAILTRRILDDHDFLKQEGRVKVITHAGEEGELRLAKGNVSKTDAKALTTFTVLYDMLQFLGADLPGAMRVRSLRPSDDILDESYKVLVTRFDDLLKYGGEIRRRLENAASAREVRAPKDAEAEGHPFMRPVVQKAVSKVASEIMLQGVLKWPEIMDRLSQLDWKLSSPPWEAVYHVEAGKMTGAKENNQLLAELLHVHIAPASKQAITRACRNFKALKGKKYPVTEEELATRLPVSEVPPATPIVVPEAADDAESSLSTEEGATSDAATAVPPADGGSASQFSVKAEPAVE